MKLFGAQKRTAKIEGKTCQRTIEADLQAAQFERIDLGSVHAWDGGYGGAISAAREHSQGCRAAIGSFAKRKSKIQHRISKFFFKKAFGGGKLVLQFLRRQLAHHRMGERVRAEGNSRLMHGVNFFPGQNAAGERILR